MDDGITNLIELWTLVWNKAYLGLDFFFLFESFNAGLRRENVIVDVYEDYYLTKTFHLLKGKYIGAGEIFSD